MTTVVTFFFPPFVLFISGTEHLIEEEEEEEDDNKTTHRESEGRGVVRMLDKSTSSVTFLILLPASWTPLCFFSLPLEMLVGGFRVEKVVIILQSLGSQL